MPNWNSEIGWTEAEKRAWRAAKGGAESMKRHLARGGNFKYALVEAIRCVDHSIKENKREIDIGAIAVQGGPEAIRLFLAGGGKFNSYKALISKIDTGWFAAAMEDIEPGTMKAFVEGGGFFVQKTPYTPLKGKRGDGYWGHGAKNAIQVALKTGGPEAEILCSQNGGGKRKSVIRTKEHLETFLSYGGDIATDEGRFDVITDKEARELFVAHGGSFSSGLSSKAIKEGGTLLPFFMKHANGYKLSSNDGINMIKKNSAKGVKDFSQNGGTLTYEHEDAIIDAGEEAYDAALETGYEFELYPNRPDFKALEKLQKQSFDSGSKPSSKM